MKASKLVEKIENLIKEHGDINVFTVDDRNGDLEEALVKIIFVDKKTFKEVEWFVKSESSEEKAMLIDW